MNNASNKISMSAGNLHQLIQGSPDDGKLEVLKGHLIASMSRSSTFNIQHQAGVTPATLGEIK